MILSTKKPRVIAAFKLKEQNIYACLTRARIYPDPAFLHGINTPTSIKRFLNVCKKYQLFFALSLGFMIFPSKMIIIIILLVFFS